MPEKKLRASQIRARRKRIKKRIVKLARKLVRAKLKLLALAERCRHGNERPRSGGNFVSVRCRDCGRKRIKPFA